MNAILSIFGYLYGSLLILSQFHLGNKPVEERCVANSLFHDVACELDMGIICLVCEFGCHSSSFQLAFLVVFVHRYHLDR